MGIPYLDSLADTLVVWGIRTSLFSSRYTTPCLHSDHGNTAWLTLSTLDETFSEGPGSPGLLLEPPV